MNERAESYIESLATPYPEYLEKIYESARQEGIPVIRPAMMDFIRTLLAMKKPMSILEVGTAVGFSALFMKHYSPEETHITTIENYAPRIEEARRNFAKYDPDGRITLLEGDAVKILGGYSYTFDMIFLDGPKGQYPVMYEDLKKLLVPGGVLLVDNVFHDGDVFMSRYALERRDRTIHARLRDFLYTITHDSEMTASVLPIADGIALAVKGVGGVSGGVSGDGSL